MPAARDPFRVLSLPYDAGPDDARRAFRERARQTHPDRGGTPDAFHEVHLAYRALTDDLEAERARWRPAPTHPSAPTTPIPKDRYPTCTVRVGRGRDGRQRLAFDLAGRPAGWRPPAEPPPGGQPRERVEATATAPAFGVWTVPTGRFTFRCVFGPPPPGG